MRWVAIFACHGRLYGQEDTPLQRGFEEEFEVRSGVRTVAWLALAAVDLVEYAAVFEVNFLSRAPTAEHLIDGE
jgi:hypothetical protein